MNVIPATKNLKARPFQKLHFMSKVFTADANGLLRDIPHDFAVVQITSGACTEATADDLAAADQALVDGNVSAVMEMHNASDVDIAGTTAAGETILTLKDEQGAEIASGTLDQLEGGTTSATTDASPEADFGADTTQP